MNLPDSSPLTIKAPTSRLTLLLSALLVVSLAVLPLLGAATVQGAPAIASLTPTIGPPGTSVTMTGFIETASGPFQIRWDSPTGAVLFSGTALVDKSISATFTVPGASRDVHQVYLVDTTWSPPYGSASFNVTPLITLSPTIGPAGATVQATGAGFYSGETGIFLLWDNDITVATGIIAGASGGWTAPFTVPSNITGSPTHIVDASGSLTTAVMVPDVTFTVIVPELTITPASGPVGTTVTISGARFVNGETGIRVTYDGKDVKTGIVASESGTWSTSYVIPAGASGISHIFDASGAKMAANTVPDRVFAITPSIAVTPAAGPAGTSVSVTGNGFRVSETGVSVVFAEVAVQSGITASAQGGWTAAVTIPEIPGGIHGIDAKGSITTAFQVVEAAFTVVPRINVTPTSGSSGTTVTVIGSGFGSNEIPIAVTFGGTIVKDHVFADAKGSFSTTFTVPTVVSGIQPIDVYGGITKDIPEVNFTVGARITANPASDIVGARVAVTGASFGKDESGIAILFDGAVVASGVVANVTGDWSSTFTVPAAVAGNHRVTAYGNVTAVSGVSEAFFSVAPSLIVAPASGNVGMQIALTGSGFAPGKTIAITYDNNPAATTPTVVTSNAQGGFSATVTIPRSRSGPHKIKVSDGAAAREGDWMLENTTPSLPSLTNPAREQRLSLFGNVPVTFQWSAVSDPSGVYYSVQVSQTPDFAKPLLSRDNLTQPAYTTSAAETLPPGTYYWRAKAIDGAYNESAWTTASSFTVGLMPLWVFIASIVGIIVVAVVVVILVRRRGGGNEKWWRSA